MESQLHNLATPTHRIQRVSSLDARSEIIDTTHLTQGWGSDVPQLFRERSRSGSNDSVESKWVKAFELVGKLSIAEWWDRSILSMWLIMFEPDLVMDGMAKFVE